jgi:hypothetical protein
MFKSVILSSVLFVGANLSLLPLESITAQNPPAETYQPGFWQPVARVDLNRPITVKLINESGLAVDYAITEIKMEPILIPEGETVTLENVQPSLYIVVYPNSKNPDSSRIALRYDVEVNEDNVVKVKIKQTEDGTESHRSFNLQNTGAIYLY